MEKLLITTALGMYAACGIAQAELVSVKDFTVETDLGSVSAAKYVSKDQRVGPLLLLNSYVVGRGWTDSGIVASKDHFLCDLQAGTVEWHIDGVNLTHVLVETGYKTYRLYKVTPEEYFDSGTPQSIAGLAPIVGFSKDDSKEFGEFKGGGSVGVIYFFGVETRSSVEEVITNGNTGGGGTCGGGGGGHGPHPTPQPTPRPTPSVSPSVPPSPTPAPTCHMPGPSPTPCPHNVPDDGDSITLLAIAVCLIVLDNIITSIRLRIMRGRK
jgi:hypothetical protein